MRQIDHDEARPLGAPIRKEPAPPSKPEWTPVPDRPGIWRDPQGRLRTQIPGNEKAT